MDTEVTKTLLTVNQTLATVLQTSLSGSYIAMEDGTGQFSITYSTPPANNPSNAANEGIKQTLCLWEVESVQTIYSKECIKCNCIMDSNNSGSSTFMNQTRLMNKTYVVGYCYGEPNGLNNVNPIGAVLVFSPGENTGVAITPTLNTPIIIGGSSVYCSFSTPEGNKPNIYRNWYGLALGSSITNDGRQKWIAKRYCDESMTNNKATAYFDNVPLSLGQTYCFAFGYNPGRDIGNPSVGMYHVFTAESAT